MKNINNTEDKKCYLCANRGELRRVNGKPDNDGLHRCLIKDEYVTDWAGATCDHFKKKNNKS